MTGAVGVTEKKFSGARCEGEHLECSPCGKVAGREQCHRLAGPGGAAVALAEINRGLYLVVLKIQLSEATTLSSRD